MLTLQYGRLTGGGLDDELKRRAKLVWREKVLGSGFWWLNCDQGGSSQLPDGGLLLLLDGGTLPGRPVRKE